MIVEIAFAYHGWPALPRYMFEAAGVVAVLAGVAVGWLLGDATRASCGALPAWAGVVLAAVLVVAMVPGAVSRARAEHKDLTPRARPHPRDLAAPDVTNRIGGTHHVLDCGQPVTERRAT